MAADLDMEYAARFLSLPPLKCHMLKLHMCSPNLRTGYPFYVVCQRLRLLNSYSIPGLLQDADEYPKVSVRIIPGLVSICSVC